jgi:hypothetical protein
MTINKQQFRAICRRLLKWTKWSNHLVNISVWIQPFGWQAEIEAAGAPFISSSFILFFSGTRLMVERMFQRLSYRWQQWLYFPFQPMLKGSTSFLPLMLTNLLCLCCTALIRVVSTLNILWAGLLTFLSSDSYSLTYLLTPWSSPSWEANLFVAS